MQISGFIRLKKKILCVTPNNTNRPYFVLAKAVLRNRSCNSLSPAIFYKYLNKSILILGSPFGTLGATNFELHYQLTEPCFLFIPLLSMTHRVLLPYYISTRPRTHIHPRIVDIGWWDCKERGYLMTEIE